MIDRSIAPEIHPIDNITLPAPDKVVLDNGIAMYVINGGVCEVCQFTIYVKGGLFEQSKKLQAQITGLMLKRGAVYLSGKEIAERLDYNGAFCNIQTHDHETEIRITCLISKLNQVLPVVFEFVTKPSFPTNELSTLKDQMSAAYAQMRRQTKYNAQCALNENLFGKNHPLAPFVFEGDVENVVAEDLADFHNNYYYPQNCTLTLSGNVSDSDICLVNKTFGQWTKQGEFKFPVPWHRSLSDDKFGIVQIDNSVQSSICIAIDSIPRSHPDYIKLRIATTALGGYFGSRLMSNIREDKGYTYGIFASLLGRSCESHILISCDCDHQYALPLINEVKKEIARMSNVPLSEDELWCTRQEIISDILKTVDSTFSIDAYVKSTLLYGVDGNYFSKQLYEAKNITADEIMKISKKYLNVHDLRIFVATNNKIAKLALK